ncbi:MAG TPA: HGGxSTG domain-containing protein [Bradyrhizobium sp.]|nr:HGGxSTG domain-containing protein [Bradyrhizobium sp.]
MRSRTRSGQPCQSPAVRSRARCKMHGGAHGSGAAIGNRNALRHGRYSAEMIAARREIRTALAQKLRAAGGGLAARC